MITTSPGFNSRMYSAWTRSTHRFRRLECRRRQFAQDKGTEPNGSRTPMTSRSLMMIRRRPLPAAAARSAGVPPFAMAGRGDAAYFTVGRGLENRAFPLELVAQERRVDQIAVVRNRDLPAKTIDHEGWRVFQRARSRRGIACVVPRRASLKALQIARPENLRHQPHIAMELERSIPGPCS